MHFSDWSSAVCSSDLRTPLAWWGRDTTNLRLGTSIVQMSGRSPASIAMHALTLDHLSNGRFILGMGVSGPQVVEGWYGQPFAKPLARRSEERRVGKRGGSKCRTRGAEYH